MPPQTLSLRQLNRATLARQGLLEPLTRAPLARQVQRLGSLQAQHPDWPPFALRSRLGDAPPADLDQARSRRSVVRASLMRMTVHIVSAEDFWPMSTLTLPFRVDQWRAWYKLDPATSPLGRRITGTHAAVLAAMEERPLPIREIEAIMAEQLHNVEIPPNRALWRHVSGALPLILVPYPQQEAYGRARYVAAQRWLGPPTEDQTDPDRAAAYLAERYLAAFGPANADDLAAYVGRGRNIVRYRGALGSLADRLVQFVDEGGRALVDLADAPRPGADAPAPARLLARWDSLLLAYGTRDRARVLPPEQQGTVITRNADVLPSFLVDGIVAGTWLPRLRRDGPPDVELRPFGRLADADRVALEAEAHRLLPVLRKGAFSRYPGTD
jgi:Winged helix DNA-binding domain